MRFSVVFGPFPHEARESPECTPRDPVTCRLRLERVFFFLLLHAFSSAACGGRASERISPGNLFSRGVSVDHAASSLSVKALLLVRTPARSSSSAVCALSCSSGVSLLSFFLFIFLPVVAFSFLHRTDTLMYREVPMPKAGQGKNEGATRFEIAVASASSSSTLSPANSSSSSPQVGGGSDPGDVNHTRTHSSSSYSSSSWRPVSQVLAFSF